jgi:hypothetical protein
MPLLVNPETVIFGNDGTMYIINEDAKLVSLHDFQPLVEENPTILTATAIKVADLRHGRPLGGSLIIMGVFTLPMRYLDYKGFAICCQNKASYHLHLLR